MEGRRQGSKANIELTLVPAGSAESIIAAEHDGAQMPVAEYNFARKKLTELDRSIEQLRKEARQQHEIISQLGEDVKTAVSELDLRRAVGLTMQEVDSRLEDVFQDSNRKCLVMFAKREEVVALQENINKKVNWTEYHNVLRKLADQRQYIETMAENVFGGRRDGLSAEFAKKADATAVAESLKLKADTTDVNEVRARLERLEVLVHNSTARHSDQLEEIRTLAAREAERESENLRVFINKNADTIQKLSESNGTLASRLHKVERVTDALEDTRKKISDEQAEAHRRQDALMDGLKEQREKIGRVDEMTRQTKGELQSIGVEVRGIRDDVQQRVAAVTQLVDTSKSRLDFLMQANETMKRKAKETNKSTASKIEVLEGEQVKLAGQFAVLEKTSKKFERDLSKVERQQLRDITCGGGATNSIQALMTPNLSLYDHGDVVDNQNMRLKGIMDQLEQIGASGNPFDHMGIDIDPKRPPLPWTGDRSARGGILDMIPKQTSSSIDSARSAPPLVAALAGEIKSNSARSSPRSGLHQSSPAKTSASSRKRRN